MRMVDHGSEVEIDDADGWIMDQKLKVGTKRDMKRV